MIQAFVNHLAGKMGARNPDVSVVEGRRVGCSDSHLLKFSIGSQQVSTLVHQSELDELKMHSHCERLEVKVQSALERLYR